MKMKLVPIEKKDLVLNTIFKDRHNCSYEILAFDLYERRNFIGLLKTSIENHRSILSFTKRDCLHFLLKEVEIKEYWVNMHIGGMFTIPPIYDSEESAIQALKSGLSFRSTHPETLVGMYNPIHFKQVKLDM